MRFLLAAILCAAAAACSGQSSEGEAAASVPEVVTGEYRAASDTARDLTGNLSLERGGLIFDKGVVLYTRALMPRQAFERVARDGDSYAAILVSSGELAIDLRRVTEQTLTGSAISLCGEEAPGYVAIAQEERATSITVLVFAGEEPPGPNATQSRLCGAFAYAAPDGARTREGVVLW
jgi:hypothetical protein